MDLALQYMEIFFSGENIGEMVHLFSDDFKFRGPFYSFDSAEDYVGSLQSDPPEGIEYEIIHSFENDSSACLIYQFMKPGISTPITQVFEIDSGKISKILLIFDTGAFTKQC